MSKEVLERKAPPRRYTESLQRVGGKILDKKFISKKTSIFSLNMPRNNKNKNGMQ